MPTSPKASVRRVKRNVEIPKKYSKDFPVSSGHQYRIRSIPDAIWIGVRRRAAAEGRSVRYVAIRALELYALGRLDLK